MKKIQVIGLFLAVSIPFCYVIYDMVSGNVAEAPSATKTEPETTETPPQSFNTYSSTLISFDYPYGYEPEENVAETFVTLKASKSNSLPIKFYVASTSVESFEEFVTSIKSDFESHIVSIPGFAENTEYKYSFTTEMYTDLPILIHKRNFESMTGDHQEAFVWLGNGNIVTVSAEGSEIFDETVKSIRRP